MIKGISNSIRRNWLGIVLVLISALIVLKSNVSGTWLTGWDALHPEFDFSLNLKRVLFGVWRADQGLGTVAYHSHMSELPRIVMLWMLTWLLPVHVVRYVLIALLLITGTLGVYAYVRWIGKARYKQESTPWPAFLAGLFYLFNLGTVQHFFVVFDMFAFQYAFIGWLLLALSKYVSSGSKKWLIALAFISFLSSPMAYAATLWYAFFAGVLLYVAGWVLLKRKLRDFKRALVILLTMVVTNLYWLAPNLYVVFSGASRVPTESAINTLFSQEAFLRNQAHGSIKDTLTIKNFLFDWQVFDFNHQQFDLLMPVWIEHIDQWEFVGLILSTSALFGLIVGLLKHKPYGLSIVFLGLLGFGMLANTTPPMSWIIQFLRNNSNLFEEVLRFPFTKFSILWMFSLSIGFGFLAQAGARLFRKRFRGMLRILYASMIVALVVWCWPMFLGNLVSKHVQKEIPEQYFELFKHMENQPQGRVLVLPFNTSVGWEYFDWGFQGAGFVWFGMPQSVIVRDFDRWSEYNETLFNQFNYALLNNDPGAFEKLLSQYRISHVLLDSSMILPGNTSKVLATKTQSLLDGLDLSKQFTKDNLILYSVTQDTVMGDLFTPDSLIGLQKISPKNKQERVYSWYGDYFEQEAENLILPFSDVYQTKLSNVRFEDQYAQFDRMTLSRSVNSQSASNTIKLPGLYEGFDYRTNAELLIDNNNLTITFSSPVELRVNKRVIQPYQLDPMVLPLPNNRDKSFLVELGGVISRVKRGERYVAQNISLRVGEQVAVGFYAENGQDFSLTPSFDTVNIQKCWVRQGSIGDVSSLRVDETLTMTVMDASACASFGISGIIPREGLMRVEVGHKSQDGALPHFCVANKSNGNLCSNDEVYGFEPTSKEWKSIERWVGVNPGDSLFLDLIARPAKTQAIQWSIAYQKPKIEYYSLIKKEVLSKNVWSMHQTEQAIGVNEAIKEMTISLPVEVIQIALDEGGALRNCDLEQRGMVSKQVSPTGSITYVAQSNGSGCDEYNLESIDNKHEYVIRFTGENLSGRGLKFYLHNFATQSNVIESILDTGQFDSSFPMSAWPNIDNKGYAINFENRSFGAELSENRLDSITLYPVNVGWLSQIRIISGDREALQLLNNNVEIKNYSNWNQINYLASVTKVISQETETTGNIIALSQGYDAGWLGYEIDGAKCGTACRLMPWWYGEKLEHVKVNGWANGWMVTSDERGATSDVNNTSNVVIVFWPQYLEWGGLLLLVGAGMFLVFRVMKQKMVGD